MGIAEADNVVNFTSVAVLSFSPFQQLLFAIMRVLLLIAALFMLAWRMKAPKMAVLSLARTSLQYSLGRKAPVSLSGCLQTMR